MRLITSTKNSDGVSSGMVTAAQLPPRAGAVDRAAS